MFCLTAEMVPSGMAIRIAVSVAMMATCSESWKRRPISSTIGRPVHIDLPKSKVTRPLMKARNCTSIGWSMPSSARQFWRTCGSMLPPPVASRSTQTSPGISAHQHEHQHGRPEQRRDHQQQRA